MQTPRKEVEITVDEKYSTRTKRNGAEGGCQKQSELYQATRSSYTYNIEKF